MAFEFQNLVVNLPESGAAGELVTRAAVGGPGAGARLQLTVWVESQPPPPQRGAAATRPQP